MSGAGLSEAPVLAVDLFSGAGGMSCGLEMSGVSVVASVERDERAHATFHANHGGQVLSSPADIHDVSGDALLDAAGVAQVDLVVGGPPCQGFSQAGYRDPADVRNSLVFQFVRLVGEIRPRFVIMENVVGMLSFRVTEAEFVMDRLCRELSELGYSLNICAGRPDTWKAAVVNAADYGVPQQRRRVIVIGWRGEQRPVLVPTHAPRDRATILGLRPHVTVGEALSDLPEPAADEPQELGSPSVLSDFARLMRAGATMLSDHVPTAHRPDMVARMRNQAVGTALYETWAHAWHRLDPDKPSPTVKENHNAPFVHPWQPRVTTPRECARLQSFPDRFAFSGPKSRKLVQIGNAVPPLLGRAIGLAVVTAARSREAPATRSRDAAAATVGRP